MTTILQDSIHTHTRSFSLSLRPAGALLSMRNGNSGFDGNLGHHIFMTATHEYRPSREGVHDRASINSCTSYNPHNRMRNEGRNRTIDEYIYVWTTFVSDDNNDDIVNNSGRLSACVSSPATHTHTQSATVFSMESLNFVMETFCFDIKIGRTI